MRKIILFTIFITFILIAGCAGVDVKQGEIVKCSNYELVLDKYIVPGPEHHIKYLYDGRELNNVILESSYNNIRIGEYISKGDIIYSKSIKLKVLSDYESNGMRDACMVM